MDKTYFVREHEAEQMAVIFLKNMWRIRTGKKSDIGTTIAYVMN